MNKINLYQKLKQQKRKRRKVKLKKKIIIERVAHQYSNHHISIWLGSAESERQMKKMWQSKQQRWLWHCDCGNRNNRCCCCCCCHRQATDSNVLTYIIRCLIKSSNDKNSTVCFDVKNFYFILFCSLALSSNKRQQNLFKNRTTTRRKPENFIQWLCEYKCRCVRSHVSYRINNNKIHAKLFPRLHWSLNATLRMHHKCI